MGATGFFGSPLVKLTPLTRIISRSKVKEILKKLRLSPSCEGSKDAAYKVAHENFAKITSLVQNLLPLCRSSGSEVAVNFHVVFRVSLLLLELDFGD